MSGAIRFSAPSGLNRRQAVLGEALDHLVTKPACRRERGVPDRGEDLRRMPAIRARLVFPARRTAPVMQTVLDPPECAIEREDMTGTGLFRGKTGDRTDRLNGFLAARDPFPGDAANPRRTGPERCQQSAQR